MENILEDMLLESNHSHNAVESASMYGVERYMSTDNSICSSEKSDSTSDSLSRTSLQFEWRSMWIDPKRVRDIDECRLKARKCIRKYKKLNKDRDVFSDYSVIKTLYSSEMNGEISICKRLKAQNIRSQNTGSSQISNRMFVMKKLKRRSSSFRELYIHVYLSSKYIVNIYDVYLTDDYIYMIMDYKSHGDLFDYLEDRELSFNDSLSIVYRISTLLKYVHSMGVIHGDIKMENILIGENNEMCLCDFGFSVFGDTSHTSCVLYTHPYTAPEQLRDRLFTYKSDVWSLGMILYSLCFNKYPFGYDNDYDYEPYEMYKLITENSIGFPEDIPVNLCKLISGMLEIDPSHRYSLNKVRELIKEICLQSKSSTIDSKRFRKCEDEITTKKELHLNIVDVSA